MPLPTPPNITPQDLADRLRGGERIVVLDIRTHQEVRRASLEGAVHIPMDELPVRGGELPREGAIAVLCHHGHRSLFVAGWLLQNGFEDVWNVEGGIDAWSADVDSAIPRY